MYKGKFISLEGIEGAGKSTALQFIKDYLKDKQKIILTREPGGIKIAEEIREILLNRTNETLQPATELLLMFAARAQHIAEVIRPALADGLWVITDRFIDASYAYQGGGRGINRQYIEELDHFVVDKLYPDLTLLLDIAPEVGFKRAENRSAKDRIEQEQLAFFMRVKDAYINRAEADPARIKIINANLPLQNVQEQIVNVLDRFIERQI